MRQFFLVLFIVGSVLSSVADSQAETQYISDRLIVSVRDSPREQYTPLASLASNQPVEVLGKEGRFVHVRTEKGVEGYIPEQYLTDETPSPILVRRLKAEIARYERQVATLKDQLQEEQGDLAAQLQSERKKVRQLQKELADAKSNLKTVEEELASTRQSYEQLQEDAEQVVEITRERDRLRSEVDDMQEEIVALEQENDTLLRTGAIKWFLAGGGVFLVGWILGKVSRKKKGRFA
ncbi:MAG TPA: TIGR04211 family SH3 domain-containing protein [Desulfuromonadales bacterium]|nr:TIGR04211 family SH3 domain-containing protein [Desulfuromonadales bacterium]